jgi:predicted phage terminase large subunit-like protein
VALQSVAGTGGDVVIFDDPHNPMDWNNDRRKAEVIQTFELLMSRRDDGKRSQVLVIGHRIAKDDLSGYLSKRGDFSRIRLPFYAPKDLKLNIGGKTWYFEKGEALRPDEYPPGEINRIWQHHTFPDFHLFYQQGLGKRRGYGITVEHFPFVENERLGDILKAPIVLSVDPAGQGDSASLNAIHVYAVLRSKYVLIDAVAERWEFAELRNNVELLAKRYRAELILIEKSLRGPDLAKELGGIAKVVLVSPRGLKRDRLREVTPIIRARRIRIVQGQSVENVALEVASYPDVANDDNVDAMTNFLIAARNFDANTFAKRMPFAPRAHTAVTLGSLWNGAGSAAPSSCPGMALGLASNLYRSGPSPTPPMGLFQAWRK